MYTDLREDINVICSTQSPSWDGIPAGVADPCAPWQTYQKPTSSLSCGDMRQYWGDRLAPGTLFSVRDRAFDLGNTRSLAQEQTWQAAYGLDYLANVWARYWLNELARRGTGIGALGE
jgi:hypothetical protein